MALLLLTGFASILGQVVLLRELNVAFYGVELIYVLAMGTWMLWTGTGAAAGRVALDPPMSRVRLLFLLLATIVPASVLLVRGLRPLLQTVPGAFLAFPVQLLGLAVALLPAGVAFGLLFQYVAKVTISRGGTLARAYALESLGGMAGGLVATLAFKAGASNTQLAIFCALACLVPAAPRAVAGMLSIPLAWALVRASPVDILTANWSHSWDVLASRDTPYCRVTVAGRDGMISVFENDALAFETEGTTAEEAAHLAAANVANPALILILGGASDGTLYEILKHRPRAVDYVELNPALPDAVMPYLKPAVRSSFSAPGVRIVREDPRRYLARRSPGYDLILVAMGEPSSGQTNRFYTREFFELCRSHLHPGGAVSFRLPAADNYWTPQLVKRMTSIYEALRAVFQDVVVLPGTSATFVASGSPLPRNPDTVAARLQEREIRASLISPRYIDYLYRNSRFEKVERLLAQGSAPPNTDDRPICYQYSQIIWLSRLVPAAAGLSGTDLVGKYFHSAWAPALLLLPASAFLIIRRCAALRWYGLVAGTGFAGMVVETAILLHYQVKSGVLYQDLGLLLTAFMAGLAAGAFVMDNSAAGSKWVGRGLLGAFAMASAIVAWLVRSGGHLTLPLALACLAVTGALVSAVFAWTGARARVDPRRAIGPLYAADLAGGCLGSVTASLLLIPAAGMFAATAGVAPLLALLLILT